MTERSFVQQTVILNIFDEKTVKSMKTLPCLNYRIAFRDVSNSVDRRTIIASIIPKNVFLTNQAPYLLFSKDQKKEKAYLLAILNSKKFKY